MIQNLKVHRPMTQREFHGGYVLDVYAGNSIQSTPLTDIRI